MTNTTWLQIRDNFKNSKKYLIQSAKETFPKAQKEYDIDVTEELKNPDLMRRQFITETVALLAMDECSQEYLDLLLPSLEDQAFSVIAAAAEAFAVCGYEPAVDGLINLLVSNDLSDSDCDFIASCLAAIGQAAVPALYSTVTTQVGRPLGVARMALKGMGPDVLDWILPILLRDQQGNWELAAGLCSLFDEEAFTKAIARAMADPNNPIPPGPRYHALIGIVGRQFALNSKRQ